MFSSYKQLVLVENMELSNLGGEGEKMYFDYLSNKNDPRHKRFEK